MQQMMASLYSQLIIVSMVFLFFLNALVPRLFHAHSLATIIFYGLIVSTLCFVFDRLIIYPYYRTTLRDGFPRLFDDKLWCFNSVFAAFVESGRGKAAMSWFQQTQGEDAIRLYDPILGDIVMPMSIRALRDGLSGKKEDFEKPDGVCELFATIGGRSTPFTNGIEYKKFRRAIHPLFSTDLVRNTYAISWSKSKVLTTTIIKRDMHHGYHDPWPLLFRYVLDSVGKSLLSYEFDALRSAWDDKDVSMLERIATPTQHTGIFAAISLFMPSGVLLSLPTRQIRAMKRAAKKIRNIASKILESARDMNQQTDPCRKDVLRWLSAKHSLNEEDTIESILMFLTAGLETTSASLAWALHQLTLPDNLRFQSELRKELQHRFKDIDTSTISSKDLENVPILHGIVEECLRLHPPIPSVAHIARRNTEIAGRSVPKGTTILYWLRAINRSPEHWGENAGAMDPYRWITANEHNVKRINTHGGALSNYGFQTFLNGPRICIGKEFSKATMRVAIAKLVIDFDITRDPYGHLEPEARGGMIERPVKGLNLNFRPLNQGHED